MTIDKVQSRLGQDSLECVDLRGANLRSARLESAILESASLYGAIFDQWTRLPFAKSEAIKRGMIYFEVSPGERTDQTQCS